MADGVVKAHRSGGPTRVGRRVRTARHRGAVLAVAVAVPMAVAVGACGGPAGQAEASPGATASADVSAETPGDEPRVDAARAADAQEAPNTLTAEERAQGWRLLFDGETTDGWRGYMRDDMPDGWRVEDGTLTRAGRAGDIVTSERFSDFELSLEWRVEPGGNSGVLYRVVEGPERTYHSGPEMQVLDDAAHPDGRSPLTSAGSNYGLHPAPRGVVRPAGEWNRTRIVVEGTHVEHWLNGEKVVEYELGSAAWEALVADSKFAQWPEYGRADEGHIALQDHGDRVWFRNIKIREIG